MPPPYGVDTQWFGAKMIGNVSSLLPRDDKYLHLVYRIGHSILCLVYPQIFTFIQNRFLSPQNQTH
jgi:hypothetical protein